MTEIALPTEQAPVQQTLTSVVNRMGNELQRALPKGMDGDRIARLALTAIRKDKNLELCSPQSFAGALLTAASLGLEPNTPAGEAYLVPYKRECTLIIGYQGWTKLFWNHPLAQHLDAQAVHANDDFTYEYGLNPTLRHVPAAKDRGEVVAYYAVARLTTGASAFVVLTPDEVRSLRNGKVGTSGGIADPMRWMERKTAVRQLFKLLPRTAELSTAMVADEAEGGAMYRNLVRESPAVEGEIVEAELGGE